MLILMLILLAVGGAIVRSVCTSIRSNQSSLRKGKCGLTRLSASLSVSVIPLRDRKLVVHLAPQSQFILYSK